MATITVGTCPLCGRPLAMHDGRTGLRTEYLPREALLVQVGFSRNGWGRRDMGDGPRINFSEEICRDCFTEAQALLEPAITFLRGERGRQQHDYAAVRDHDLAPEGHRASLLRSVRALLPAR